ncbi:hypothetical protein TELCIR_18381, partial [Teladorsagia circumcincta]
ALVTVKWGWNVEDYAIRYAVEKNEHIFTIDGTNKINNIMKLVKFHQSTETPVYGQVVLRKAIPKQQWELTNDKITKIKVIGSGAFGEVWLGNMQESPKDPPVNVAIKVREELSLFFPTHQFAVAAVEHRWPYDCPTKVNEKTKTMIDEMYREARLMRQYQHK